MSMTDRGTGLVVETLPPGGGALAAAVRTGALPPAWETAAPRGTTLLVRAQRTLDTTSPAMRATLAAWAPAAVALAEAAPAARARFEAACARGLLVTTGQQPGLFGGPLYTWHKALAALALADALEARLGVPVAPLFWAATDDADVLEGASTWVADARGAHRVAMPVPADAGGRVVAALPLPALDDAVDTLRRAAGSAAHASLLDDVRACYRPGATIGSAYVALLRRWLEPHGIVVLDAAHRSVREAAHATCRLALAHASPVDAALRERGEALRAHGFTPQVDTVDGRSLVFRWHDDAKDRVSLADAHAVAGVAAPGALSGNVLLRPVIERALFPTAAYVAGPGELAYFAQVGVVAQTLGLEVPAAVPRWSARVIEPRVADAVGALGVAPASLADPEALLHTLAGRDLPAATRSALDRLTAQLEASLTDVAAAATAQGVPSAVVDGARRQMAHRVDRLTRRLVAHAARADAVRAGRVALAAGALYPGRAPQERALNAVPLLARWGPALWDAWRAGAAAWAGEWLRDPA
jgi:bacillithiol biosynthesis cysteine-adding enzyme BshC